MNRISCPPSRLLRRCLAVLLTLPAAHSATADDDVAAVPSGRVVRIDGPEIYIDIGRTAGATEGVEVILYRRIVARHPQTGARLEDRFELVRTPITDAGAVLSRLRLPRDLAVHVNVGDDVRLAHTPPPVPPVVDAPAVIEDARPDRPARGDPDVEAFRLSFSAATGADRDRRLRIWRGFLEAHPDSDLAPLVSREIEAIEAAEEAALPAPPPPPSRPAMAVAAPGAVLRGEPVRVVAATVDGRPPAQVVLHYKRPHEEAFRFRPMDRFGEGAFAGEIPQGFLEPPFVEWYAVAVDTSGREHRLGTTRANRLRVSPPPEAPSRADRSELALAFQYVDFYRFQRVDAYTQVEGEFTYRTLKSLSFEDTYPQLYAVRMGFGAYQGIGGSSADVVDAAESGDRSSLQEVGFNFGHTELELRFHENVALMGRLIVGILDTGLNVGGQASLRIGPELGTNLVLGALGVGELGQTYQIALAWDTVPRVPMGASVEVTTWPVSGADLGVRLLYEARYRFTPWFELGGRVGYGLRNIDHGGLTVGLGTVFSW